MAREFASTFFTALRVNDAFCGLAAGIFQVGLFEEGRSRFAFNYLFCFLRFFLTFVRVGMFVARSTELSRYGRSRVLFLLLVFGRSNVQRGSQAACVFLRLIFRSFSSPVGSINLVRQAGMVGPRGVLRAIFSNQGLQRQVRRTVKFKTRRRALCLAILRVSFRFANFERVRSCRHAIKIRQVVGCSCEACRFYLSRFPIHRVKLRLFSHRLIVGH